MGGGRLGALFLGVGLAAAAPAGGEEIAWSLHDRSCAGGVSAALRVGCGDFGVLLFDAAGDGGCPPLAAGSETPRLYPHPPTRDLAVPFQVASRETARGGAAAPGDRSADGGPGASSTTGTVPGGTAAGWAAVIDWADAHGASVLALIELLAGEAAPAVLYALDGPDLASLGSQVGDQHVLARLCAVAEEVEIGGSPPPLALNMSFGRLPQAGDPASAGGCDRGTLSCQIAHLLARLADLGVAPVAAAGNHGQLLFPASLDEVLAAAPLDVTWFVNSGIPAALWEAPAEVDALLPGHALCVAGAVVPAGSSYASAFFTGWYAFIAAADPGVAPFAGTWAPAWSPPAGCYVLAQGGSRYDVCNPGLEVAVAGITGGAASGCWEEPGPGGEPLLQVPGLGPPEGLPAVPSFDEWVAQAPHPAPESDPCIPCVGGETSKALALSGRAAAGGDIVLNLTASIALDAGAHLQRVYLRAGDDLYPLDLAPADLAALESGEVGGLLLAGYGALLPTYKQMSLVYLFVDGPGADCSAPPPPEGPECFWSSTPVLLQ